MKDRPEKSPAPGKSPVRLQRFLAQAGIASRRRAEDVIAAGRVAVNGKVVTRPGTVVDPLTDSVSVDGKPLRREVRRLFLFHKPRGVVTTLSDPQGRPTIADYTKSVQLRLYPVGRLDFDVSGLLILTNDGDLAHRLMHPKFESRRVYWARVAGRPGADALNRLLKGVELDGRPASALAVKIIRPSAQSDSLLGKDRSANSAIVEIEVGEGRKHLVKDLFKAIEFPVLQLARIRHGEYNLGDLKPGEIREISAERDSVPRKPKQRPHSGRAARPARVGASGPATKRVSAADRSRNKRQKPPRRGRS